MMKSTSINMGGIFLEQSVKTQSKLTQMIKMLLVAYLVTGLLLLILAFLLCKFQLNENQIHLGILVTYILSCFVGSFALGKSIRQRCFLWGMGLGASERVSYYLWTMHYGRGTWGNVVLNKNTCLSIRSYAIINESA